MRPQTTDRSLDHLLRPVQYKTGEGTLLKQLKDTLTAQEDVVFVPWTFSRIVAFYLSLGYKDEQEVRLLIKRYPDGINRAQRGGAHWYWPIPISAMDEFSKIARSAVEHVLAGTPFASVPIEVLD